MTVTTMEILGLDGDNLAILPLDRELDDALAAYAERRWPRGRRKSVEREWDLSPQEAKSVVEGKATKATIAKILKHHRGGFRVGLVLLGAVIGKSVHEHFREEIREAAREQSRREEHARIAAAAYRRLENSGPLRPGDPRIGVGEDWEDLEGRRSA